MREAARTLDFSQPVAIMLIAVMHLIVDADDPYGIVGQLKDAMPPGSYLALSQVASDIEPERMAEAARQYNQRARETQRHRTHAEVARFFDGLELLEPGVVVRAAMAPPVRGRGRSAFRDVGRRRPPRMRARAAG